MTHHPHPSWPPQLPSSSSATAAAADHLLLSVSPPMGERTTTATEPQSQDPIISPSAPPPSAATKIPFRPRKLRKLSPTSSSKDPTTTTTTNQLAVLRILPRPLTLPGELSAALRHLRSSDPHLAPLLDTLPPPSFPSPTPPFLSLARSILYQQLASKAAASIYDRFLSLCGGEASVLPAAVLALSPHQFRQIGVSARKASYLHDLARKYHNNILSDAAILAMDDKSLFSMLTMVKGIGAWSVHMFMLFSLHRPDVLPVGDLGVRKGVQMLYGLDEVPRPSQMEALCERWRPYRSVGAWYMWRLVEAKGSPSAAAGVLPITGGVNRGGGGVTGGSPHLHPQQAQFIDPLQMLPNMG